MRRFFILLFCLLAIDVYSQKWAVSYPVGDEVALVGGDCNSNGNFIVGACGNTYNSGFQGAYAMYAGKDGDYIDKTFVFL